MGITAAGRTETGVVENTVADGGLPDGWEYNLGIYLPGEVYIG
jgi:hypothetical protein